MTISRKGCAALALAAALLTLALLTRPPAMPAPESVRTAWTPSDAVLLDRHGRELSRVRVDHGGRRGAWVPLAAVSPALAQAVVAGEDRRFRAHGGVDARALAGAAWSSLTGGGARGASTITMQVAGLLRPELGSPGARSPWRKLAQARAAWALERRWSKDQLLEAYLNLAPWRGELVGVDAAARALLGKRPAGLTRAEAAALAALLPAPRASPATWAARACAIARRAFGAADCVATGLAVQRARDRDHARLLALDLAPHAARRLLHPGVATLRSTLDRDTQIVAHAALARRLADLERSNARDGAAVVVDNATGDVLAYVGSAGPGSRAGAVDGAAAPRQAGSTLKPHLYALAIERRLLTAASILDDAPVHLETASGLYVPRDYDDRFRGPVSVRTALGNSLNVPAVRAALLTGVEPFRQRLHDGGYRGIAREGDYYGFSLALGSAEVTLLEQAAAYRALARGGRYAPLRLTPGPPAPARRVVATEAAWIVADILADPDARRATFGGASALDLPFPAAVKTGTSKAMRDNWCVGFTDRFTVAVWVGNFEGDPMAGVSGVTGAAPAWREIMLWLHRDAPPRAPAPPPGVRAAAVAFVPAVEPARREWFVAGTELATVRLAASAQRPPRLLTPADGAVVALDPDIPPARQRVPIRVEGGVPGLLVTVDGRPAPALWRPTPGAHHIELALGGRVLDRARVTVR